MKKTGSLNFMKPHKENLEGTINTISEKLSPVKKECPSDTKEPVWKCRYTVTLLGFLVALSMACHRTLVSVVIVAMVNNTAINQEAKVKSNECPELRVNATEDEILHGRKLEGELIWSPKIQGYVLGSFFFGFMTGQLLAGRLTERYGCKWFIFGALLATAILTILIPPFAWVSASAVIVIQALRGFAQGTLIPATIVLVANWCPKTERGFLYSIILSAHSLGCVLGNIFAGYVSEEPGGWPYVYYSLGGSGIAFAVCILIFIVESPKEHPRISTAELNFILNNQERKLSRRRPKLPWRDILRSIPVYALLFAYFGRHWTLSLFWIVYSTFLGTILHYSMAQNGIFSAIPFLLSFLLSLIVAWISLYIEQKKVVSVDVLRKFWVIISSLGISAFLYGSYIAGCNRNLSVICAILCVGFTGLGTSGCLIVSTDMSPTFAGTIESLNNTVGFLTSVLLPILVGYLTDGNQTLEQWNKVFFISIGLVMSSAITFAIFGSAKTQPWNFAEEHTQKDEKQTENHKNDQVTKF